ncbi:MAG: CapA family protein [Candidatus Faecousia sp.]|nr:CapA family protein [Candidatus Faecousia sp.]
MSQKPKRSNTVAIIVLTVLILLMIAATAFLIYLSIDLVNKEPEIQPSQSSAMTLPIATQTETATETTEPPTTTAPEPEHVVATATIGAQGDLLMHKPVFDSCRKSDGSYDFSSIFQYTKDVVSTLDYALANLETTFGGDKYTYQGNPAFNCPDGLMDSVVDTGYDMLLTANNHAGDTMGDGIIRTVEKVREAGLTALGSQLSGEKRYAVVDVNGIKIGMVCYTWAFSGNGSTFSLNGLTPVKDEGQMNYFVNTNPDKLYTELKPIMDGMKADGAEATMIFLHWGQEYQLKENTAQQNMAQKLCDMGFDVIVGGHPHVVQPMALLESTENPGHKTYCIYSLGNAVSNQRTGVSSQFPAGYTEDGVLFTVTFEKYSDGKVYVAGVNAIPTWVNMHSNNGSREYNILPLDKEKESEWESAFRLTSAQFSAAQKSYDRTMGIIGEGLAACQNDLEQAKADREQYYLDLATNPEAAEAAPETAVQTTAEEATIPDAA